MAAEEVAATVGIVPACRALGVARSSLYRHRQPAPEAAVQARRSYRALTDLERENVLSVLHSERFIDQAPAEIYATLLDKTPVPSVLPSSTGTTRSTIIYGIGLLTPESMHYGKAGHVTETRQKTLLAAYSAHPERFNKPPQPPAILGGGLD